MPPLVFYIMSSGKIVNNSSSVGFRITANLFSCWLIESKKIFLAVLEFLKFESLFSHIVVIFDSIVCDNFNQFYNRDLSNTYYLTFQNLI